MPSVFLKKPVRPNRTHVIFIEALFQADLDEEVLIYTKEGWIPATREDYDNQNIFFHSRGSVVAPFVGGDRPSITKAGTITIAANANGGDISLSGLKFRPSLIYFIASVDNQPSSNSNGWSDGFIHACVSMRNGGMGSNLAKCVDVTDGTDGWSAVVKSMDNDGFTITPAKVGQGKAVTIKYLALK